MQPGFTIDVLTLESRRLVDFLDIQSFQNVVSPILWLTT